MDGPGERSAFERLRRFSAAANRELIVLAIAGAGLLPSELDGGSSPRHSYSSGVAMWQIVGLTLVLLRRARIGRLGNG